MIRVPSHLRDRVRQLAAVGNDTYSDVITEALNLLEQERFWQQIAQLKPDKEYGDEFAAWDHSNLA